MTGAATGSAAAVSGLGANTGATDGCLVLLTDLCRAFALIVGAVGSTAHAVVSVNSNPASAVMRPQYK